MPNRSAHLYRRLVERLHLTEDQQSIFWALVIGAVGGLAAFFFRGLIEGLWHLLFHLLPHWLGFESTTDINWQMLRPLVPALGGLIVGPMVYRWAIEARGHGVPEVMLAMGREGGRIRPRVGAIKAVASSVTLGSGGSAGQEGPIVQVGSALGSLIGQWLHLPARKIKTFVACGAAAGISAVFSAPIAGVFFSIEVLLGELRPRSASFVVLSSAAAWVVARTLMGDDPLLVVPEWEFTHSWEFIFWVILGVLAAGAGRLFVVVLYWLEDRFAEFKIKPYLKPMVGGLMVGLIGIAFPHVFGSGYRSMTAALNGTMYTSSGVMGTAPFDLNTADLMIHPLTASGASEVTLIEQMGGSGPILGVIALLLVLALVKILATSFTLGSGGSGGVFAPALFVGAMLGGAFGLALQLGFPGQTAPAGAYAVIGMAATFAASAQAPVTAILIIFELTHSEALIPATMVGTVVATMISHRLGKDSIYTVKFRRRGWRIGDMHARDPMKQIQVREAMATEFFHMQPTMTVRQALLYAETVGQKAYPVVGESETDLRGLVTIHDLNLAIASQRAEDTPLSALMDPTPSLCTPEDHLDSVIEALDESEANMLPVVASRGDQRLVGVLTHATMIRAYNEYQMDRE